MAAEGAYYQRGHPGGRKPLFQHVRPPSAAPAPAAPRATLWGRTSSYEAAPVAAVCSNCGAAIDAGEPAAYFEAVAPCPAAVLCDACG